MIELALAVIGGLWLGAFVIAVVGVHIVWLIRRLSRTHYIPPPPPAP